MNIADPLAGLPPLPPGRELPQHWLVRQELLRRIDAGRPRPLRWLAPLAAAAAVAAITLVAALVLPGAGQHGLFRGQQPGSSGLRTQPAAGGSTGYQPAQTRRFVITTPVSSLVVTDDQGNVTVTGSDRSSIVVIAQVPAHSGPPMPAWTSHPPHGTLNVGYYPLPSWCTAQPRRCPSVNFDIQVPRALAVRVIDETGDTSVSRLSGPASVSDAAGNVVMTGLSGRQVTVRAQAGDVHLSAVSSPQVSVADQAGNVIATASSGGKLTVRAAAGDVRATGLADPVVNVWDSAGDIFLGFAKVPRQVLAADEAGSIGLALPPGGTAYRIAASAPAGGSVIAVPTSPSSPDVLRATAGAGNISIRR